MNFAKYTVLALAATAALTLPALSHATSMLHAANSEAGYTYYPEHAKSTKTRAQVSAETATARKDGSLDQYQAQYQLNVPVAAKDAGRQDAATGSCRDEQRDRRGAQGADEPARWQLSSSRRLLTGRRCKRAPVHEVAAVCGMPQATVSSCSVVWNTLNRSARRKLDRSMSATPPAPSA